VQSVLSVVVNNGFQPKPTLSNKGLAVLKNVRPNLAKRKQMFELASYLIFSKTSGNAENGLWHGFGHF